MKMMKEQPDKWFAQLLTKDDTSKILIGDDGKPLTDPQTGELLWGPIVTDQMIADDIATGMSEELAQQEYYCDFNAALQGAYYSKELTKLQNEDRRTKVLYNPNYKVHTAWDLGLDDAMAIWFFQIINDTPRIINYKEWTNTSLKEVITEIKTYQYVYGTHLAPHDITQRELTTKESRYSYAKRMGVKFYPVPKLGVADGIEAARRVLAISLFDEENTLSGYDCLVNYTKKWDDKRKVYLEKPEHNWASHGADAFRYLAVGLEHIHDFDEETLADQAGVAYSEYNVYSHEGSSKYVANSDYDIF